MQDASLSLFCDSTVDSFSATGVEACKCFINGWHFRLEFMDVTLLPCVL